jgi:hypothetical protein
LALVYAVYLKRHRLFRWSAQIPEIAQDIRAKARPLIIPQEAAPSKPKAADEPKLAAPVPPSKRLRVDRKNAGYITLISPLKLRVWLGDKYVGDTPLESVALPAGNVKLRLENVEEGYLVFQELELKVGELHTMELTAQRGTLRVSSQPSWAFVQIGTKTGVETPVNFELYAGDYQFTFECPNGKRQKMIGHVDAGETGSLVVHCK